MAECQISINAIPNPTNRTLSIEMLADGVSIGAKEVDLQPMFDAYAAANPTSDSLPTIDFLAGPGAAINNASNNTNNGLPKLWNVENVPFAGDGLFWVNRDTNGDWYWKQVG